jgi:hypothetical protein
VLPHYAFIVDDNEHEYQDDGQKNAVDHLRKSRIESNGAWGIIITNAPITMIPKYSP